MIDDSIPNKYVPAMPSAAAQAAIGDGSSMAETRLFPMEIESVLKDMTPTLAVAVRAALQGEWRGPGFADAQSWRPNTLLHNVQAMLDINERLRECKVAVSGIDSLVRIASLNAIVSAVKEGIWLAQNIVRLLVVLQKFYRLTHGTSHPILRTRIAYWRKQPRRAKPGRERSVAELLDGATRAEAAADQLMATRREAWGRNLLRGAAILAMNAELNFRRGELYATNIEGVRFYAYAGNELADIYVNAEESKGCVPKIGSIFDPRALALLRRMIGSRAKGPIFLNDSGGRLSYSSHYSLLQRATKVAFGVGLDFNDTRRSGASASSDPVVMGNRLGNSAKVAVDYYRANEFEAGRKFMKGS
jgi:hypothetical protein